MPPDFGLTRLLGIQLWQLTLVILAVGVVATWCRRRQPHLAYVLWLVVLAKAITPPLWVSNTSLLGLLSPPFLSLRTEQVRMPAAETNFPSISSPSNIVTSSESNIPNASARSRVGNRSETKFDDEKVDADWIRLGVAAWLSGTIILTCVSGYVVYRRSRLLQIAKMPIEPSLQQTIDRIAKQLGVRRKVSVVVTSSDFGPALCGLWRPMLVLPQCILEGTTPKDQEAVITHELIHLRRGDHLATVLQCVVQVVWWFHPLMWWANRRICIVRERCCDQESVCALEGPPSNYANCLLEVLSVKEKVRPIYGFPGVRPVHVTAQRVKEIITMSATFRARTPVWCWYAMLLAAVIVLPGSYLPSSTVVFAKENPATSVDPSIEVSTAKSKKKSDRKQLLLKYGDNKADGKKSIAGAGEMIRFELPAEEGRVRAIKVHGSRYGYPQAPKEDFEVTLLSEDMTEILHTELVPYSLFKRQKKGRWTFVPFREPVDVPKTFWVVLNFNAERTKGVYVSYDTSTKGQYSRVGTNEEDARETKFAGDWMVQVLLAK